MARFNLQRFLGETGLSLVKLASHLQVAQTYLRRAAAGKADLTRRDQEACRALWRRLTQAEQLELPFAEPPETFTREHARRKARARSNAPAASTVQALPVPRPPAKRPGGRSRKPAPAAKAQPKIRRKGARGSQRRDGATGPRQRTRKRGQA